MRNGAPPEPAKIADERIVLAQGDRLMAEQAGPGQEPALDAGEDLSEGLH
jgi:hypothetical protein